MRRGDGGGGTPPSSGVQDWDDGSADADTHGHDAAARAARYEANDFLLRWHRLAIEGEVTMGGVDPEANRRCFDSYVDCLADDDDDDADGHDRGDNHTDDDEHEGEEDARQMRRSFVAFLGTDASEVWTSKRDFVAAISGRGEGLFGWHYWPITEERDEPGGEKKGDDFHVTSTDGFRNSAQFWATLVGRKTDDDSGRRYQFYTRCFGALVRVGDAAGGGGFGQYWRVAFYDLSICIPNDELRRVLDLCGYHAGVDSDGSVGAPPANVEGDNAPTPTDNREEAFLRFMDGATYHLSSLPWRVPRRQRPPECERKDGNPTHLSDPTGDWVEFANLFAPSADGGGGKCDIDDGGLGGGGGAKPVSVRWIGPDASETWGMDRLVRERGADADAFGRRPSDGHEDAPEASCSCFSLDDYRTGGNWYATITVSASLDDDNADVDAHGDGGHRKYAFPLRLSGFNFYLSAEAKTVEGCTDDSESEKSGSGSWAIGRCKASLCVPNGSFYRVLDLIRPEEEDGSEVAKPPPHVPDFG